MSVFSHVVSGADPAAHGDCYCAQTHIHTNRRGAGTTAMEHTVLLWLSKGNRGFSLIKKKKLYLYFSVPFLFWEASVLTAELKTVTHRAQSHCVCVCVMWKAVDSLPRHKAVGPNRKLHTLPVQSVCVPAWLPNLFHTNILPDWLF